MKQPNRFGFTLIELLIVIGVLGILATGLLAAVDPFEQLKKGRDTNRRNTVVEFHNASIRYYASHGDMPWYDTGGCFGTGFTGDMSKNGEETVTTLDSGGCVDDLITDGELKEDYVSALGSDATKIYITSPTRTDLRVCFSPESKSVYYDDATKYDQNGDIDGVNCDRVTKEASGPGAGTLCYWCAK